MRDIYYQSVGNPVQTDRLPVTRPSTEFAPGASTAYAGRILLQVSGIAMIIGAVVLLVYRAPGYALNTFIIQLCCWPWGSCA
jgi:hypothetical protein